MILVIQDEVLLFLKDLLRLALQVLVYLKCRLQSNCKVLSQAERLVSTQLVQEIVRLVKNSQKFGTHIDQAKAYLCRFLEAP